MKILKDFSIHINTDAKLTTKIERLQLNSTNFVYIDIKIKNSFEFQKRPKLFINSNTIKTVQSKHSGTLTKFSITFQTREKCLHVLATVQLNYTVYKTYVNKV